MPQIQPNAGESVLKQINITTMDGSRQVDVRDLMSQLYIYEDLFKNFISGFMIINDTVNIFHGLPLLGEEILEIKFTAAFRNSESERTFKFWIYNITDLLIDRQSKYQIYKLNFVSYDQFINVTSNPLSFMCRGSIGNCVKNIMKPFKKPIKITDPPIHIEYLVPYNTPMDCVKLLAERSSTNINNDPGIWLLYETDQSYYFNSLINVINDGKKNLQTLNNNDFTFYTGTYSHIDRTLLPDLYYRGATDTVFESVKDTFSDAQNGKYNSSNYLYDISTRSFINYNENYISNFNNITHIGNSKNYPQQSTEFLKTVGASAPYVRYAITDSTKPDYTAREKSYNTRNIYLNSLKESPIIISVAGDPNITIGDVVNLNIGERSSTKTQNDIFRDAEYLVGRQLHKFNKNQYNMILTLYNDYYASDVNRQLNSETVFL